MSLQSASKWFYLLHNSANKALFDELQAIAGVDARIAFAKAKCYEFTIEEFQQAAGEAWDSALGELSDEQLDGIAGGAENNPFKPGSGIIVGAAYATPGTYNLWQLINGG